MAELLRKHAVQVLAGLTGALPAEVSSKLGPSSLSETLGVAANMVITLAARHEMRWHAFTWAPRLRGDNAPDLAADGWLQLTPAGADPWDAVRTHFGPTGYPLSQLWDDEAAAYAALVRAHTALLADWRALRAQEGACDGEAAPRAQPTFVQLVEATADAAVHALLHGLHRQAPPVPLPEPPRSMVEEVAQDHWSVQPRMVLAHVLLPSMHVQCFREGVARMALGVRARVQQLLGPCDPEQRVPWATSMGAVISVHAAPSDGDGVQVDVVFDGCADGAVDEDEAVRRLTAVLSRDMEAAFDEHSVVYQQRAEVVHQLALAALTRCSLDQPRGAEEEDEEERGAQDAGAASPPAAAANADKDG